MMWLELLPILLCFVLGLGFLIVEMFLPGFGLPGISGIVLEGAAVVITYLRFGGLAALGMTLIVLAVIAIAISLALRSADKGRLSRSSVILNQAETPEEGYVADRKSVV